MVIELVEELVTAAKHLFQAKWQHRQFSTLLNNLPLGWVVLNMDFAENYVCVSQNEIQSAHWGHA